MRKRPNIAGIAWLVFVGLAAAAAQSLPLVQTLWLAEAAQAMRQASHEPTSRDVSPANGPHAISDVKPQSTAG